jgi:hypothetical protein
VKKIRFAALFSFLAVAGACAELPTQPLEIEPAEPAHSYIGPSY